MKLRIWGRVSVVVFLIANFSQLSKADDWIRFRGPNGSGVSQSPLSLPKQWSATENLAWKVDLPGPGHSSPVVSGDKIFLTYWSGYGVDRQSPGQQEDLKRHLLCLDRKSGKTLWDKSYKATLPEDNYRGMFAEHGYATHTPVTDGEVVVVFFGKSGVLGFDLEGNELWKVDVGDGLDPRGWGSASSPILYQNMVIVLAAAESQTLMALDKKTGKQLWKQVAEGLTGTWSTPILVPIDKDRTDIVLSVPYEVWGLNPESGKLRWYADGITTDTLSSSPISVDGIIYLLGARGGQSMAMRAGGQGDVTASNALWQGNFRGGISSPVLVGGKMYWINDKIVNCVDAQTGKEIYQARLKPPTTSAQTNANAAATRTPVPIPPPAGRRGGGAGGQDYASPVAAGDKLYYVTRNGDCYIIELSDQFNQVDVQSMSDGGEFTSTPAISNGQLLIRSTKALYCIGG